MSIQIEVLLFIIKKLRFSQLNQKKTRYDSHSYYHTKAVTRYQFDDKKDSISITTEHLLKVLLQNLR